jgi:hypothetical protein
VIRDDRRREETRELDPAVTVRRPHHGNLDALIAQSSDTSGPFSFDHVPPFELEPCRGGQFTRLRISGRNWIYTLDIGGIDNRDPRYSVGRV